MASSAEINGRTMIVGDQVWWYGTKRADGDPYPATVFAFGGGTALDLHVNEPGRVAFHRCVRHAEDSALEKMTADAIRQTGVWRERSPVVPRQEAPAPTPVVSVSAETGQAWTRPPKTKQTVMEKLISQPLVTTPT